MARQLGSRPIIHQIAIVGDGFTEKIYFDQLREYENLKAITIKPELPSKSGKGGSHAKVFKKTQELIDKGYSKVYCLIDYDTVIKEDNFDRYQRDKARIQQSGKIEVLENNPCFEFWFLLHFRNTATLFTSCGNVETELCKHIHDYCKAQDYLYKKKIYSFLKPDQKPTAVDNARLLEIDRVDVSPRYPRAEVFKLVEELTGK